MNKFKKFLNVDIYISWKCISFDLLLDMCSDVSSNHHAGKNFFFFDFLVIFNDISMSKYNYPVILMRYN